ncbi:uncharacterized protein [Littorina saxatilis]|uniref:uncharacterized protein n=1 Tax=Littorina saxatilis TaxID=31220 RepID=UPI0038B45975
MSKRLASPLQDLEKRPCPSDSLSDPDETIITCSNELASSTPKPKGKMSQEDQLKEKITTFLSDPDILKVLSKAVASQVIAEFRKELGDLKTEVAHYRAEVEKRDSEIVQLREKMDDLEQYSRRNCIRINNIPEMDKEDTDIVVKAVGKSVGVDLTDAMIDRSHRVGRRPGPGETYNRAIICKFTSFRFKLSLMRNKKNLSQTDPRKIFPDRAWPAARTPTPKHFINDDLTQARSELAAKARQLKREKKLEDTWVRDGVVFAKQGSAVSRVTTMRGLLALL